MTTTFRKGQNRRLDGLYVYALLQTIVGIVVVVEIVAGTIGLLRRSLTHIARMSPDVPDDQARSVDLFDTSFEGFSMIVFRWQSSQCSERSRC